MWIFTYVREYVSIRCDYFTLLLFIARNSHIESLYSKFSRATLDIVVVISEEVELFTSHRRVLISHLGSLAV